MALLLEAAVLPLSLGLACEESLTVSSMPRGAEPAARTALSPHMSEKGDQSQ